MPLITLGQSTCTLCGKTIREGDEIVAFPPFVSNVRDPLFRFNDFVSHRWCFERDPLVEKAQRRWREVQDRLGPGNRFCAVCHREITDPDEYFTLGHLTEDETHPLYPYNYTQLHQSCLPLWPQRAEVYERLKELQRSGAWQGHALDGLIGELERFR